MALIILSLLCPFYYNYPMRRTNDDGSTDYKAMANTYYSDGLEGFGWGKTNSDGFMNLFDYDDDTKIDVLIMGSSHMEALQVNMSRSTASQLDTLLENETVYNIGVASHTFLVCANNLRAALTKYHPTKYVVIVTNAVSFSDDAIALAINEETPEMLGSQEWKGIVKLFRKSTYIRLLYNQLQSYMGMRRNDIEEAKKLETLDKSNTTGKLNLLDELLRKMSAMAEEYNTKLMIVYHPGISVSSDGTMNLNVDQNAVARFKISCDANKILFLDMSDRFKEEYESAYILPYGFSNTPVGSGHLNRYGHAMMADELYRLISEDMK